MANETPLSIAVLDSFPAVDEQKVEAMLKDALASLQKKIVVLDDDPTGVQTVNNVSVYTDWKEETLV